MGPLGTGSGMVGIWLFNLVMLAVWLSSMLWTLFALRSRDVPPTARVLWAGLIVLVPVLGALAFLIAGPPRRSAG
jgi:hypothetical protein